MRAVIEEIETGSYKQYCATPADTHSGFTSEQLLRIRVQGFLQQMAKTLPTSGALLVETVAVDLDGKTRKNVQHFYFPPSGRRTLASRSRQSPAGAAASVAGTSAGHANMP